MSVYFSLSIRFCDPRFHGCGDGGAPEWPPSPLRVYQTLVASAARLGNGSINFSARGSLTLLERSSAESPPIIVAPGCVQPSRKLPGYCLSVPNNVMDIVAKAWSHGNYSNSGDASQATHRTMKTVRPTHLIGGDTIHYLWALPVPLADEHRGQIEVLTAIAHSITSLGWGVDMAVGDGSIMTEEEVAALPGERWLPASEASGDGLHVPIQGTLDDLMARHEGFLKRMEGNMLTPPPLLSVYKKIEYRRATDPQIRPIAAFSLLRPDASGFRPFDTVRQALTVAGMTRHAAACAAERTHLQEKRISNFILGHGESQNTGKHISVGNKRFAYLPLPSIESRGEGQSPVVGNVRRVMLTAFDDGCQDEIAWARRTLSGQSLEPEHSRQDEGEERASNPVAILSLLPASDNVVKSYICSSATWATVTPVVLPGYDDPAHYRRRLNAVTSSEEQKRLLNHLDKRIDGLLRKAILQAGFSKVMADCAEIEWRKVGYWRGTELADRYGVPDHLKRFPRYHVKIEWGNESSRPVHINGPICLGGGRHYGLGLFAAMP
ncbi:MAG: type I-U CRISPR-associated protein Cas5/Cas6 [Nitrospirae bacterium]|nr:type I-U CRISPR-associated protein Cas5/Cas6 [Nitrospirota bacterium]